MSFDSKRALALLEASKKSLLEPNSDAKADETNGGLNKVALEGFAKLLSATENPGNHHKSQAAEDCLTISRKLLAEEKFVAAATLIDVLITADLGKQPTKNFADKFSALASHAEALKTEIQAKQNILADLELAKRQATDEQQFDVALSILNRIVTNAANPHRFKLAEIQQLIKEVQNKKQFLEKLARAKSLIDGGYFTTAIGLLEEKDEKRNVPNYKEKERSELLAKAKDKKDIDEKIAEAGKLANDPAKALQILKTLVNNKYAYKIEEINAFIESNNLILFKQALEKGNLAQVTTLFDDSNVQAWAKRSAFQFLIEAVIDNRNVNDTHIEIIILLLKFVPAFPKESNKIANIFAGLPNSSASVKDAKRNGSASESAAYYSIAAELLIRGVTENTFAADTKGVVLDETAESEILRLLKPRINLTAFQNDDHHFDAKNVGAPPTPGIAKLMATAAADSPRYAAGSASAAAAAGSAQPPSTPLPPAPLKTTASPPLPGLTS